MTDTEKRWSGHVSAWAASGLSCKEYAAKAKVNPRTLIWWKSKLGAAAFVEVTSQVGTAMLAEPGELELVVGRVLVRVRGPVDADALTRVLDVLEGRA